MSYQVLARKYRPRTFGEVVGQDHAVRALMHALDADRLHHAYLFTGTRGVGKTTLARAFAKCLNCETGVGAEPCGTCSACTEIAEGRFVDLIEVDAASRTRVDDTRELLDNVQYLPSRGRFKVYLIDEVHMLSASSFNALLKTLEEPPPHVKFLLATTDPKKVPVTVLSRCLQFHLRNILPERIAAHLGEVLTAEEVSFEPAALDIIAEAAQGSLRDALSVADQAIAFGGGALAEADVADLLGTVRGDEVGALLGALVAGDREGLLRCAAELAERNADFADVLASMQRTLHDIAMGQTVGGEVPATAAPFVPRMAPEDVQLYYQIALMGGRDLQFAPDPRVGFEMTLIQMLAFRPVAAHETMPAPPTGGNVSSGAPAGDRAAAVAAGVERGEATPAPAGTGSADSKARDDTALGTPAAHTAGATPRH
ncbi:MAG: DNA polymerase III subunit gamma/tau, partial [Gammaproteobacteria bacterium]|nr:DNA polymerase III subunit gamma/tau [Gammaproteobacteria bacterium]